MAPTHSNAQRPCAIQFLELPREIRDKIYDQVYDFNYFRDSKNIKRQISTSLLFVNRQVHHEANEVMCKKLRFVHVTSNAVELLPYIFQMCGVPVICLSRSDGADNVVNSFRKFVMSIALHVKGEKSEDSTLHIMLLAGDMLDWFCKSVMQADTFPENMKITPRLSLDVKMLDPFDSVEFTQTIHTSLVTPLQTHWRGLDDFQINGAIGKDTAKQVTDFVTSNRFTGPAHFLAEIHRLNDAGKAAFRTHDYRAALGLWNDAVSICNITGSSRQMRALSNAGGVALHKDLMALMFNIHSNRTAACLKKNGDEILAENEDGSSNKVYAQLALGAVKQALSQAQDRMARLLHWQPTVPDMAKLFYRKAVAHTLDGDLMMAEESIREALRLTPYDMDIAQELDVILEMQHDEWLNEQ